MRFETARFDGAAFDMDGVLTSTAALHERAWEETFAPILANAGNADPFTHADYRTHIDGRPRERGAEGFLKARSLPADPAIVASIASAKNDRFNALLDEEGAIALPGAAALLSELKSVGVRVGVFTASRNADRVLRSVGLREALDALVDGNFAAREGLNGKPAPDTPLALARRLGVLPGRCALFEDSTVGIRAGAAAGFGRLVGIGEGADADRLKATGADVVVPSLMAVKVFYA